MIVRDVFDNGVRLITETHGSRAVGQCRRLADPRLAARAARHGGIAHFVEHMLFKGTAARSAQDIAQAIDSIGGQLDAFTAKEYAATTSRCSTNTCRRPSMSCRISS